MELPKVKTKVIHSETKPAWNVVATEHGDKYKIARVPYSGTTSVSGHLINNQSKQQAFEHASFISECFNKGKVPLKAPSVDGIIKESFDESTRQQQVQMLIQLFDEAGEPEYTEGIDY